MTIPIFTGPSAAALPIATATLRSPANRAICLLQIDMAALRCFLLLARRSLPFAIVSFLDPAVGWKPAVAESGSMAKASERLAITHPVVSKTISDLEQSLGVRLFDRTAQGVELTTYGQALLKCGLTVFDELRQGIKQIESLADPNSGELRIGCPEIMIAGVLPALAEQFLRQYSKVRLHVVHADTALRQFDELRKRNVELLIGRLPRPFVEEDLIADELFDEPFLAFSGIDNRWARRRQINVADLIDEPWVLPPYDSTPGMLIAQFFRS